MWQCARCGKQDRKNRMAAHILKDHIPLHQVPYHCLLCQFRCQDSSTLRDHVSRYSRHVNQEKNMRKPINYAQYLIKAERPIHVTSHDMFQVADRLSIDLLRDDSDGENQPPSMWPSWMEPESPRSTSGPVGAKGDGVGIPDLDQLIRVLEYGETSNVGGSFPELRPANRTNNTTYAERPPTGNPVKTTPGNVIFGGLDGPSPSVERMGTPNRAHTYSRIQGSARSTGGSCDQVIEDTAVLPSAEDHLDPLFCGFDALSPRTPAKTPPPKSLMMPKGLGGRDQATQAGSSRKEDTSTQTTLEDSLANVFEAGMKRITQAIDEGIKAVVGSQRAAEATLQEVKRIERNVRYLYRSVAKDEEEENTEEPKVKSVVMKRKSTTEDDRKHKKTR